ncbi:MAG: phosphatase family protein [Rhodospirillales bacterium]|nr:phosphatase family protein [Rhodospirillales bacterium]
MSLDLAIFHVINGVAGSWTMDRIVNYVSDSTMLRTAPFLVPLWYFWMAPSADLERRRRVIMSTLLGVAVSLVANRVIASFLPFRVRPMFTEGIGFHALSVNPPMDLENWSSFPSDNATFFFALATGLFFLTRRYGIYLWLHALAVICLPRIYMGIHYPSDIAVGAVLGIIGGFLALVPGLPRLLRFSEISRWSDDHRGVFAALFFLVTMEMALIFDDLRNLAHGFIRGLKVAGLPVREEIGLFAMGAALVGLALIGRGIVTYRLKASRRPGEQSASGAV